MWSIHIICLFHPYSYIWKPQEYNTLFKDKWNYFLNQVLTQHEKESFISWNYWLDGLKKLLFIVLVQWTFWRRPLSLNDFCRMFHTPAAAPAWEQPHDQCLMLPVIWHFEYCYSSWFCTKACFSPWGRHAYSTSKDNKITLGK